MEWHIIYNRIVYIYNAVLLNDIKEGSPVICDNMEWRDFKCIMLSEISRNRKTILFDLIYMWNLKENSEAESRMLTDKCWWMTEIGGCCSKGR